MSTGKKTIYSIEKRGELEKFELIMAEQLEIIIRELPKKKGTEEGISSDILKMVFCVIKQE